MSEVEVFYGGGMLDAPASLAPRSRRPMSYDSDGGINVDARMVKLEADVCRIQLDIVELKDNVLGLRREAREDFRVLFAALIVAALGLASIMAHGFKWL